MSCAKRTGRVAMFTPRINSSPSDGARSGTHAVSATGGSALGA